MCATEKHLPYYYEVTGWEGWHTLCTLSITEILANLGCLWAHVYGRQQTALSFECVTLCCDTAWAAVPKAVIGWLHVSWRKHVLAFTLTVPCVVSENDAPVAVESGTVHWCSPPARRMSDLLGAVHPSALTCLEFSTAAAQWILDWTFPPPPANKWLSSSMVLHNCTIYWSTVALKSSFLNALD